MTDIDSCSILIRVRDNHLNTLFNYLRTGNQMRSILNDFLKKEGIASYHLEILNAIYNFKEDGEINQNRIAKMLGASRTSMPRYFSALKENGFIKIGESKVSSAYGNITITAKGRKLLQKVASELPIKDISKGNWDELSYYVDLFAKSIERIKKQ